MNILIADRQAKVRFALSILLQEQPGWTVSGVVNNKQDLFTKVTILKPDVLLLDWSLLGEGHAEIINSIRHQIPDLRIIVMSVDPEVKEHAMSLGVMYFVSKVDSPKRLVATIQACEQNIVHKNFWFASSQLENLLD